MLIADYDKCDLKDSYNVAARAGENNARKNKAGIP